jgi:hypothetical protein
MTSPEPFNGPLFIVGMVRSGTKLLRGLLLENPRVQIPAGESDLLPMWIDRWDSYGDLSRRDAFDAFYREASGLPYLVAMTRVGFPAEPDRWYAACPGYDVAGVFEGLIRTQLDAGPDALWGDKTPSYTRHVGQIAGSFPEARFVHIVRDVRDYCLSVNKAWGKNLFRAAQRWSDDVRRARTEGAALGSRYLEVRYEDLIADPGPVMERVCRFAGVEFDPSMLSLSKPSEVAGDAGGMREVKRDNAGKYRTRMDASTLRRIEAIAGDVLRDIGYDVDYTGAVRRIGPAQMMVYQCYDAVTMVRGSVRELGWRSALKMSFRTLAMRR